MLQEIQKKFSTQRNPRMNLESVYIVHWYCLFCMLSNTMHCLIYFSLLIAALNQVDVSIFPLNTVILRHFSWLVGWWLYYFPLKHFTTGLLNCLPSALPSSHSLVHFILHFQQSLNYLEALQRTALLEAAETCNQSPPITRELTEWNISGTPWK